MKKILFALMLGIFLFANISAIDLTECQIINESGVYVLQNNITDTGDCFGLDSSDVILDGNGYALDITGGNPIFQSGDFEVTNITIKNIYLYNPTEDINAYWVDGLVIENSFLYSELYNLAIGNLKNVIIRNNYFTGGDYCIDFQDDSEYTNDNFLFYNNYFDCGLGVFGIGSASYSNIFFNTTQQTGTRIFSDGTEIGGNYFVGYSESCDDLNTDGFCDTPFDILNDTTLYDYLVYSDEYTLIVEEEEIESSVQDTALYQVMASSGAGLGVFIQFMASSLPVLLIVLAMVGIIVIVGLGIAKIIKFRLPQK